MDIPVITHKEIFVIGDVHGCATELNALLDKLPLKRETAIVFLGDYIDRGPASRQVVETLLELGRRLDVFPLLGNHESLLLDLMSAPTSLNSARFIYNGGGATLQSYSKQPGDYLIPDEHLAFLRGLKLAYQSEQHLFVHAGLPDVALDELDEARDRATLLWVRGPFLNSTFSWSKTVVHGHTHVRKVHVDDRRINVDTGCVYDHMLSAIHLPSREVYQVARRAGAEHGYLREPPGSKRKAVRFEGRVDVALSEPRGLPMFNTMNYNDFGLLLRSARSTGTRLLALHQQVEGTIFPNDSYLQVTFKGVVVRVEDASSGFRYGIRFHAPAKSTG